MKSITLDLIKLVIFLGIIMSLFACFFNKAKTFSIDNAGTNNEFTLNHSHKSIHIHTIQLNIKGNVDGESSLTVLLNDKPYKVFELKDNFDINYQNDWYSDSVDIQYKAGSSKNGEVKVNYEFFE